jgi:isoquinoline 1-oxidoreductase beta subunit
MITIRGVDRRTFLRLTGLAGGGLILAATSPGCGRGREGPGGLVDGRRWQPSVFLRLDLDDTIEVVVSRTEMGQGVRTGLPMIVAEELDVVWDRVRVTTADAAADDRYGSQLTGGSLSVRQLWEPLRRAGATARALLVETAAEAWGVTVAACSTELGDVVHAASGRRTPYRELIERAASRELPDPESVELKSPEDFRLVGCGAPSRTDALDFVTGRARFGMDTRVDGALVAAVARCPVYGGRLGRLETGRAEAIPGVRGVVRFEGMDEPVHFAPGVAVLAEDTAAAMRGARALEIVWEPGANAGAGTDELRARLRRAAQDDGSGAAVRDDGDVDRVLRGASEIVAAEYDLPFLAHAPMEPPNCTVSVRDDRAEIWSPTQNPQGVQRAVARFLGVPREHVAVHVTLTGGGFGRRLYPDIELEAAAIARQVDAPVHVVWTRGDDLRHDQYRPASHHRLRGAIGKDGTPLAWSWHIANTHTGRFVEDDFPAGCVSDYRVRYSHVPWILPRGAWRSTVYSQNPFVVHSFLDELAAAGGADPVELRLRMLRAGRWPEDDASGFDAARLVHVLEVAADLASWGSPLPKGTGRGVAFQYCYDSYVAEVAEVEVSKGAPRIRRVACALDCGQVIHRDLVEAQIEGAIAFGLTAALHSEVTVDGGRVEQGNFDDYPALTLREMPKIESVIVESSAAPGGVGETPLPPVAPALAGAIFDATGTRVRRLPIGKVP